MLYLMFILFILLSSLLFILNLRYKHEQEMQEQEQQADYLLQEIQRFKDREEALLAGKIEATNSELKQLELELEQKKKEIVLELEEEKEQKWKALQVLEQEQDIKLKELQEDMEEMEKALEDLKTKKSKSIEILRDTAKQENKKNFHRIILSEESRNDIQILLEVEKRIHNKDVLRKLIYKTYVERQMNETFNRIGVATEPGIYKIENIKNGKTYIGQSTNVRNRLREHVKASLGISSIAHQRIHEAMNQEGLDNFTFEVIEVCDRADLNNREKYWIEFFQSNEWGYNKTRGNN